MKNYTIEESFTLPSEGKIYDYEVIPQVRIRSMTVAEEQKRLSVSDTPYKMMCDIIDDCIIDDIGISSYDMCLGDYQYCLHRLRVATYGADYKLSVTCPYCGCTTEEVINLDELPVIKFDEACKKYFEFDLPQSKAHVKLRVQTPRMLDVVRERVKTFRQKASSDSADPTLTYTVVSLLAEVNHKKPDPIKVEEWVKTLPMRDVNTILSYAEKCNEAVGVDTSLHITCNICGLGHTNQLKLTNEFFRPTLDI